MIKQSKEDGHHLKYKHGDKFNHHEELTATEKPGSCPVCNMKVDSSNYSVEYSWKIFYFCSEGCRQKFKRLPWNYFGNHHFDLIIIGGGPAGLTAAVYASVSKIDTFFIANDIGGQAIADKMEIEKIRNRKNIRIIEKHDVLEIYGDDKVEGVYISPENDNDKNPKSLSCQGVFIQVGFLPNTEFCRDLVELNDKGEIKINGDCSTNTDGIFACGDVTDAYGKRIIIASGEGAKAVLRTRHFLKEMKEA